MKTGSRNHEPIWLTSAALYTPLFAPDLAAFFQCPHKMEHGRAPTHLKEQDTMGQNIEVL